MKMETSYYEPLPEGHWARIADRLAHESGRVPDPLEIRAAAIISVLGLPSGETSALTVDSKRKRTDLEKDRIIAEHLTNHPGVIIDKKTGITSTDFRDIYPDGLPLELKKALDPDTLAIMEIEYEHGTYIRKKFGDTQDWLKADYPIHYFRLPGGIDLFSRGYYHDKIWHENNKQFLQRVNKHAEIVCIEGSGWLNNESKLDSLWSDPTQQFGHFDALMHEAVDSGFKGLFAVVDARDRSKITMDHTSFYAYPYLPQSFYQHYLTFLRKEHPHLSRIISSEEDLEYILARQSISDRGIQNSEIKYGLFRGGKNYAAHPYLTKGGEVDFEPTFLELGHKLFSDALAAIKLHLIARLMTDGHILRGPIVDYEGTFHLSSKSFFLRYPQYALVIVLRTINELMAGRTEEKGNLDEIYTVFKDPNWTEVVKEIAKLIFRKMEDSPLKTTSLGPDQKKLLDYPVDFLKIYGINASQVMPTDEEIQKIRGKLSASFPESSQ